MPTRTQLMLTLGLALTPTLLAAAPAKEPMPAMLKLQDQSLFTREGAWISLPLFGEAVIMPGLGQGHYSVPQPTEGKSGGYQSFRNGYFWRIQQLSTQIGGKEARQSYLYRRAQGPGATDWEQLAEVDTTAGIPHYLVPLDRDGWFLAVGPYAGFFKEERASYVALFRRQGGKLQFQELVDMPFGDRSQIADYQAETHALSPSLLAKDPTLKPFIMKTAKARPTSLTPNLWLPALLPDHLVLGASQAGVLWVFNLSNGQCHRSIDLGGVAAKDLERLDLLDHFLLSAQPDSSERLLVVTRTPDVVTFATALCPPPNAPTEVRRENKLRFLEILKERSNLQWWSIDPVTGAKEKLDDPERYPVTMPFQPQAALRFLVGPDGRVHANTKGGWPEIFKNLGLNTPTALGTKPPEAPKAATTPAATPPPAPPALPPGR